MNTLMIKTGDILANRVSFGKDKLYIFLSDGRELGIPIEWFPRLRNATKKQRDKWRLIAGGIGVHWDSIDEDISVEGLLK